MSFDDVLKGYQPQENEDEKGFDILKGRYKCKVNHLKLGYPKGDDLQMKPAYKLELQVVENIDGDKGIGRRFWKSYPLDNEDKVKQLLNDLFTAGIKISAESQTDFEAALPTIKDAPVHIRAWGFPPFTRRDGTPNVKGDPEHPQEMQQTFVVYNPAKVKATKPATDKVPF